MNDRKKQRRMIPCCFAAAIAAAMAVPVPAYASPDFAYTQDKWATLRDNVMEYNELADLVHEYNTTVQNNRVEYQDYYDKDQDDISNEYFRKAADAADAVQYPNDEDGGYAAKYADAMMAEVTIRSMRQQGLDNLDDGEIKGLTFAQAEAGTVQAVQKSMIAYNQYQLQLKQARENRRYLEAVYNSVQTKAQAGLVTQSEVLAARQNMQDVDTTIAQLERSIQDNRQALCVATGWRYDAQPEIGSIPQADPEVIHTLNPTADKETALSSNYTLKINERKLHNSQDSTSTQKLQIAIHDNRQKINSDIDLAYNAVLQAQVSYQQALAELDVEARNMETAVKKQQSGSISALQYLQQENNYVQKQVNAELKNIDLFQALESYQWNVKGLGSSV